MNKASIRPELHPLDDARYSLLSKTMLLKQQKYVTFHLHYFHVTTTLSQRFLVITSLKHHNISHNMKLDVMNENSPRKFVYLKWNLPSCALRGYHALLRFLHIILRVLVHWWFTFKLSIIVHLFHMEHGLIFVNGYSHIYTMIASVTGVEME